MKNILIIGTGRAGKTALSNMIKEKYNSYNLIHSDSIEWAMIKGENKETYYKENIKEQKKFEYGEYFQRVQLEFFNSCIREDIHHYGYILESSQLEPKYIKEMIDFNQTVVICLGHGNLNKEDIIQLCRENDREKDWTYHITDQELEAHAENWTEINELLKKECEKYEIKYIDTSKNREKVLRDIIKEIGENERN